MDGSRIMLSRRINSHDLQRHVANIQELVLRARWHNYYIALFDDLLLSGHDSFTGAVCEEQDLVDRMFLVKLEVYFLSPLRDLVGKGGCFKGKMGSYFVTDFTIHGDFHCNKL
jgi:hypothetical protein